MFALLGLCIVLLSWVAGAYLVSKWRGSRSMSISRHAASADRASKFFTVVLVIGGVISYIWLIWWFTPALKLSPIFVTLSTLALAALLILAVIPDTSDWKSKLHRQAAYSMAFLFLPLSYYVLASPVITTHARIAGLVCGAYMIIACVLFLFVKKARDRYLLFQALYIMAFQGIILSAAYLR